MQRRFKLRRNYDKKHFSEAYIKHVEELYTQIPQPYTLCRDTDSLLHHLIDPYKGKVIYLDFWGTWCAPCKREIAYAPAVKEALKGQDVIFMYLANNSPEDSWKNVIKENHSTGINVVHFNLPAEQQGILEKHLSIRFFPTFMLIDKKGNLVNKNAPSPSQKTNLVNKTNELLAN